MEERIVPELALFMQKLRAIAESDPTDDYSAGAKALAEEFMEVLEKSS